MSTENDLAFSGQEPLRLTGRQKALHDALLGRDPRLAEMYRGAIVALSNLGNPERFPQAAHSIRELLEKMPVYLGFCPRVGGVALAVKVNELRNVWEVAASTSPYIKGNSSSSIDRTLGQYIRKSREFFEWLDADRPLRVSQVRSTLHGLDPSPRKLPPALTDLRISEWQGYQEYFVKLSHHRNQIDEDEFLSWLDALEIFLLDRLRPRTFHDQEDLLKMIEEAEGK